MLVLLLLGRERWVVVVAGQGRVIVDQAVVQEVVEQGELIVDLGRDHVLGVVAVHVVEVVLRDQPGV